jgi:hypothetical protein
MKTALGLQQLCPAASVKSSEELIANFVKIREKFSGSEISDSDQEKLTLEEARAIKVMMVKLYPEVGVLASANSDDLEGIRNFFNKSCAYSDQTRNWLINMREVLKVALVNKDRFEELGFSKKNSVKAEAFVEARKLINKRESDWIQANKDNVSSREIAAQVAKFDVERKDLKDLNGNLALIMSLRFVQLPPAQKIKFLDSDFSSARRPIERAKLLKARKMELAQIYEKEGFSFDFYKYTPKA